MSKQEIIELYSKRLDVAEDKFEEINKILNEVDNLKFESGEPITEDLKIQLLEMLIEIEEERLNESIYAISESDNASYLLLVQKALEYLKSKK